MSAGEYAAVRSARRLDRFFPSRFAPIHRPGPSVRFCRACCPTICELLKPFEGQYATLLTQQGKVIADVRVLCSLNSFYLDFWESLKDKILDHLNRYLVADEVEIADRSQEYSTLSIQGPRSEALLRELVGPTGIARTIPAARHGHRRRRRHLCCPRKPYRRAGLRSDCSAKPTWR